MSVRKRGNRFVATVWDTQANKKVWVGTYETRREAQDAERQAWGKARKRNRTTETCASLAARWVDDYPRQKESTNINYRERIARFAKHFGELPLNDLVSPGPYLELFARRARFGWDYAGDESLGTVEVEGLAS